MRGKFVAKAAIVALLPGAAWAQVGAPLLGYLPEGGHILPVHGIAASASAGAPLNFSSEFLQAAVSPHQDFALVSALSTGAVAIAVPAGTVTPVAGATAFPSSITLSPSGSAAVLWFASTHIMEVLSGLPSSPAVRSVNASFLSGSSGDAPATLAVSDDGAWAAGAWPDGVWGFGPNGEVRSLLAGYRGQALTFFAGREDLAVAGTFGVDSITDVGGSATVATLNTPSGSTAAPSPVGLGVTPDNTKLVLADQQGNVSTIDASTGSTSSTACGCAPVGVLRMGGSIFRITGLTGSVFRVFDARTGSVFQIPIAQGVTAQPVTAIPSVGREAGGGLPTGSAPGTGGTR